MRRLLSFCLGLALSLIPFSSPAKAEEMSIDDLLTPDLLSMNDKVEIKEKLARDPMQKVPMWDDLLGPEDNFPFLPDNHRDSGTGKFNAFK